MPFPLITPLKFKEVEESVKNILLNEEVNQQAQAVAASQDPQNYEFTVYRGIYLPFDAKEESPDTWPIVNVRYKGFVITKNNISKATANVTLYIDLYVRALNDSEDLLEADVIAHDRMMLLQSQVFTILHSEEHKYLGLKDEISNIRISAGEIEDSEIEALTSREILHSRFILEFETCFTVLKLEETNNLVNLAGVDINLKTCKESTTITNDDISINV